MAHQQLRKHPIWGERFQNWGIWGMFIMTIVSGSETTANAFLAKKNDVQKNTADSSKHIAKPIRCGSSSSNKVALTFDDGPSVPYTKAILAVLKKQGIKATFFVLGKSSKRYPHLLQAIAGEGHLIANHSWDHPRRASLEEWRSQILRTEEAIQAAGVKPSKYFRPPHGVVTDTVRQICHDLGYTIILYTVLTSDWQKPAPEVLTKQVIQRLGPGGIGVLHDGGGNRENTVRALPDIINGLRQRGFIPSPLEDLLGPLPH